MSTYTQLKESIELQLMNGIDPFLLSEEITRLSLMEAPIKASNARVDRVKSRAMSRASTRNRLRRTASRPTNQRRMKQGYERWLKLKGSKELSKTAARRFESYSSKKFELEDVRLATINKLVDVNNIFNQFSELIQLEDCTSDLEKMEYLYNNFPEQFTEHFIKELDRNGVIMDPIEEDTTTASMPQEFVMPYDGISPFYTKDKKKLFKSTDLLPLIIREVTSVLYDLLETNEEEPDFQGELVELISDIEDCGANPTEESIKELENFQDFLFGLICSDIDKAEISLVKEAAKISLKRPYEDLIMSITREGKSISEKVLNEIKKIIQEIENE